MVKYFTVSVPIIYYLLLKIYQVFKHVISN